ncbi:MAG: hypothetical protein ACK5M1_01335 [Xanthomarina gelatinilytica]|uniref:hypothetical protein n=1 Tax=Xanthomarina gelatinilytica TaxID=1137281 RepID=UPI003A8C7A79
MKKILYNSTLLILILSTLYSCSNDDDNEQQCMETNVTMTVNGESQTFQAIGRGIDLRQNGYELHLNLDRRNTDPFREQGIVIILPYKKTGENIIEQFIYHQYIDNTPFNGDFLDGEFQSNVITNTNKCFYATFSGILNNGNQEVIITEGKLSYEYEKPFDE